MTTVAAQFMETALHLPQAERALLAERLLASLDTDDFALSPEWQTEIARRVAEIERGEAKLIPAEDVFRNAFAALS
jgi:putative addiction module component (TIGR02574 family)